MQTATYVAPTLVEPLGPVEPLVEVEWLDTGDGKPSADSHPLPPGADSGELLALVELILKDGRALDQLTRNAPLQPRLIPRFLALSLAGFCIFGATLAIVIHAAGVWPVLAPIPQVLAGSGHELLSFAQADGTNPWLNGQALQLVLAYSLGLIAATGICLPSLYFYGLLAGVRMSMLDVVAHAMKGTATTALALVGILPIYTAFGMAVAIFRLPYPLSDSVLRLGLILPFIAGLWGVYSLYRGFLGLVDTLPRERQCQRQCFLRRLVLSWAAVYTAVTPVMIFTLWQWLGA